MTESNFSSKLTVTLLFELGILFDYIFCLLTHTDSNIIFEMFKVQGNSKSLRITKICLLILKTFNLIQILFLVFNITEWTFFY